MGSGNTGEVPSPVSRPGSQASPADLVALVRAVIIDHESEHGNFHDADACECSLCDLTVLAYPTIFGKARTSSNGRNERAKSRILGLPIKGPDAGRKSPAFIFVYGTLRRGFALASELKDARFVGRATTVGRLFDVGPFPAATRPSEPDELIFGEVYEPEDVEETLRRLDRIEGYRGDERPRDNLFRRDQTTVRFGTGREVVAWIYLWNRSTNGHPRIAGGDFLEHRARAGRAGCS